MVEDIVVTCFVSFTLVGVVWARLLYIGREFPLPCGQLRTLLLMAHCRDPGCSAPVFDRLRPGPVFVLV